MVSPTKSKSSPKEEPSLADRIKLAGIVDVDLGWRRFNLSFVKKLHDEAEKVLGITDFEEGYIRIEDHKDDSLVRETIIHEIVHCMLENAGFGGGEDSGTREVNTNNEQLTILLSRQMMQFFNSNRELFEILLEETNATT